MEELFDIDKLQTKSATEKQANTSGANHLLAPALFTVVETAKCAILAMAVSPKSPSKAR